MEERYEGPSGRVKIGFTPDLTSPPLGTHYLRGHAINNACSRSRVRGQEIGRRADSFLRNDYICIISDFVDGARTVKVIALLRSALRVIVGNECSSAFSQRNRFNTMSRMYSFRCSFCSLWIRSRAAETQMLKLKCFNNCRSNIAGPLRKIECKPSMVRLQITV